MKFIAATSAIVVVYAFVVSTVSAAGASGAPWGYKYNDPTMASPTEWGEQYPHCNGSSQSPIDIVSTEITQSPKAKSTLGFRGNCPSFNLTQTDEGFKASVVDGSCQVSANGAQFNLLHLHAPSEHTLNGDPLDGEVHFVHGTADAWLESVALTTSSLPHLR